MPPESPPMPPAPEAKPPDDRRPGEGAARSLPFSVGERARYDVSWLGLGAGLTAGTAEFVVLDGGDRPGRFRFHLTAVTASWVSAFFEARDQFWTLATRDLLPLEHRQELREGRRRVDRTVRFDRAARLLRAGDGPLDNPAEGVTRALPPEARDPLSAMYYVRTLTWEGRDRARLAVTDLGLDMAIDVQAGPEELIDAEGRSQRSRRLSVRMEYLTERIPTPKATVWLSADPRRIPLAAEVETDVGVFRMALVQYTAGPASAPAGGPVR
jgi:hypothetical protein